MIMEYTIPTKMDPMSYEILTNNKFDYSILTWENTIPMIEFWALRLANPTDACRAWIELFGNNRRDLFNRMFRSIIDANDREAITDDEKIVFPIFKCRRDGDKDCSERRRKVQNMPLENFDEATARLQHGNWPIW